jgi:hypothetical protein
VIRRITSMSTEGLRRRPEDQLLPVEGRGPLMHDVLIADLRDRFPGFAGLDVMCADVKARQQLGVSRYGKALQAFNGRDCLLDAYEELLDFLVYALQTLQETEPGDYERHGLATAAYEHGLLSAKVFRGLLDEH